MAIVRVLLMLRKQCSLSSCFFVVAVFWMTPVDVAVVTTLLALQIGAIAAVCGVSVVLLLVPMQFYLANRFGLLRRKTAARTDERVRHTSEVVTSISSVKSFAWEPPFWQLVRR